MPENLINCQNLPCPEPVLRTKKHLDAFSPQEITVIVDNAAACENITRFLQSRGYTAAVEKEAALWHVSGVCAHAPEGTQKSTGESALPPLLPCPAEGEKIVVVITGAVIGTGDDSLGARLMKNFLTTLPELGPALWRVILLNGGVTLAAHASTVVGELQRLEEQGVSVLVCGTCLEHFGLLEKKAVGQTTNMLYVVTSMQLATKTIHV